MLSERRFYSKRLSWEPLRAKLHDQLLTLIFFPGYARLIKSCDQPACSLCMVIEGNRSSVVDQHAGNDRRQPETFIMNWLIGSHMIGYIDQHDVVCTACTSVFATVTRHMYPTTSCTLLCSQDIFSHTLVCTRFLDVYMCFILSEVWLHHNNIITNVFVHIIAINILWQEPQLINAPM